MVLSRYDNLKMIVDPITNGSKFETFPPISLEDVIDEKNDIVIEYKDGMRFDILAHDYLGDGRYWWAICILNNIHTPFGTDMVPGSLIRIPTNISKILNTIQNKINSY